jgi:hypothetical protein
MGCAQLIRIGGSVILNKRRVLVLLRKLRAELPVRTVLLALLFMDSVMMTRTTVRMKIISTTAIKIRAMTTSKVTVVRPTALKAVKIITLLVTTLTAMFSRTTLSPLNILKLKAADMDRKNQVSNATRRLPLVYKSAGALCVRNRRSSLCWTGTNSSTNRGSRRRWLPWALSLVTMMRVWEALT